MRGTMPYACTVPNANGTLKYHLHTKVPNKLLCVQITCIRDTDVLFNI